MNIRFLTCMLVCGSLLQAGVGPDNYVLWYQDAKNNPAKYTTQDIEDICQYVSTEDKANHLRNLHYNSCLKRYTMYTGAGLATGAAAGTYYYMNPETAQEHWNAVKGVGQATAEYTKDAYTTTAAYAPDYAGKAWNGLTNTLSSPYTLYAGLGTTGLGAIGAGVYYYMNPETAQTHFDATKEYAKNASESTIDKLKQVTDAQPVQTACEYTGKAYNTVKSPFSKLYNAYFGGDTSKNSEQDSSSEQNSENQTGSQETAVVMADDSQNNASSWKKATTYTLGAIGVATPVAIGAYYYMYPETAQAHYGAVTGFGSTVGGYVGKACSGMTGWFSNLYRKCFANASQEVDVSQDINPAQEQDVAEQYIESTDVSQGTNASQGVDASQQVEAAKERVDEAFGTDVLGTYY